MLELSTAAERGALEYDYQLLQKQQQQYYSS